MGLVRVIVQLELLPWSGGKMNVAGILQKNFVKFGDIRKLCTYRSIGQPSYNTTSGAVTGSVIASEQVYIIFDDFNLTKNQASIKKIADQSIRSIDKIVIFPSLDLSFLPKTNDVIVDDLGVEWIVVGIQPDPADAHFELYVQKAI